MAKTRSDIILKSGYFFIAVNFFLAVFNILIGILANSLAIASDAIHSLTDSISGFLIIISEKLANHRKLSDYRIKIERITTIIIATTIILLGLELIISSIKNIYSPEEVNYSVGTIIVLIASITTKFLLAKYLKDKGKEVKSDVLSASGAETLNDTWISIVVLVSIIINLIFKLDIESYASIFISLIIIKTGLEFIFPHLFHHHHHHLESNKDHDHCGKDK